jgi:hypothetical protein
VGHPAIGSAQHDYESNVAKLRQVEANNRKGQVLTSECVTGVEVSVPTPSKRFGANRVDSDSQHVTTAWHTAGLVRRASQRSVRISLPMNLIEQLFSRVASSPLHTPADLGRNKFAFVYKIAQSLAQ